MRGRKPLIDVSKLKVGQYMTLVGADRNTPGAKTAYWNGYYSKDGKKFSVLKCLEGLRVWRVAILLFITSCKCSEPSYLYYQNDSLRHANMQLIEYIETLKDTL